MAKNSAEKLVELLNEYMYRQSTRYENEIIILSNNVSYRGADPIDHLEMIMAQTRAGTADKIFYDLRMVVAIWRGIC